MWGQKETKLSLINGLQSVFTIPVSPRQELMHTIKPATGGVREVETKREKSRNMYSEKYQICGACRNHETVTYSCNKDLQQYFTLLLLQTNTIV